MEVALEIGAELTDDAPPDDLAAISKGLVGEAASEEDVKAAFALFRQA